MPSTRSNASRKTMPAGTATASLGSLGLNSGGGGGPTGSSNAGSGGTGSQRPRLSVNINAGSQDLNSISNSLLGGGANSQASQNLSGQSKNLVPGTPHPISAFQQGSQGVNQKSSLIQFNEDGTVKEPNNNNLNNINGSQSQTAAHAPGTMYYTGLPGYGNTALEDTMKPAITLREKAELRTLIEGDMTFALLLEEQTNSIVDEFNISNSEKFLKSLAGFMWKTLMTIWNLENAQGMQKFTQAATLRQGNLKSLTAKGHEKQSTAGAAAALQGPNSPQLNLSSASSIAAHTRGIKNRMDRIEKNNHLHNTTQSSQQQRPGTAPSHKTQSQIGSNLDSDTSPSQSSKRSNNGPLPRLHIKQKLEVLELENSQLTLDLNDCRQSYLKELTTLREQIRCLDEETVQKIDSLVHHEEPIMYYEPVKFIQDDKLKNFIIDVVEEKLKLLVFHLQSKGDVPATLRKKSKEQIENEKKQTIEPEVVVKLEKRITELESLCKGYQEELVGIQSNMKQVSKAPQESAPPPPEMIQVEKNLQVKKSMSNKIFNATQMLLKQKKAMEEVVTRMQSEIQDVQEKTVVGASVRKSTVSRMASGRMTAMSSSGGMLRSGGSTSQPAAMAGIGASTPTNANSNSPNKPKRSVGITKKIKKQVTTESGEVIEVEEEIEEDNEDLEQSSSGPSASPQKKSLVSIDESNRGSEVIQYETVTQQQAERAKHEKEKLELEVQAIHEKMQMIQNEISEKENELDHIKHEIVEQEEKYEEMKSTHEAEEQAKNAPKPEEGQGKGLAGMFKKKPQAVQAEVVGPGGNGGLDTHSNTGNSNAAAGAPQSEASSGTIQLSSDAGGAKPFVPKVLPGQTANKAKTQMLLIRALMFEAQKAKIQLRKENENQKLQINDQQVEIEDLQDQLAKFQLEMDERLRWERAEAAALAEAALRNSQGSEVDESELRARLYNEIRSELEAEFAQRLADSENSRKISKQLEGDIEKLKAQLEERDKTILEMEKEIDRLKLLLEELHLQLEQMKDAMNNMDPSSRQGTKGYNFDDNTGKVKKIGERLNWVVKQSHSNVFERLYMDAVDRIRRMEKLRVQFMEMQRSQLYDLITHEDEMGNLVSGGTQNAPNTGLDSAQAQRIAQQNAYQAFLASELQRLQQERAQMVDYGGPGCSGGGGGQVSKNWGNPLTDADMLKAARQQLNELYPASAARNYSPEQLGQGLPPPPPRIRSPTPQSRPLSGNNNNNGGLPSKFMIPHTTTINTQNYGSTGDIPTIADLAKYPIHNNFHPGVANFGTLDFANAQANKHHSYLAHAQSGGQYQGASGTALHGPNAYGPGGQRIRSSSPRPPADPQVRAQFEAAAVQSMIARNQIAPGAGPARDAAGQQGSRLTHPGGGGGGGGGSGGGQLPGVSNSQRSQLQQQQQGASSGTSTVQQQNANRSKSPPSSKVSTRPSTAGGNYMTSSNGTTRPNSAAAIGSQSKGGLGHHGSNLRTVSELQRINQKYTKNYGTTAKATPSMLAPPSSVHVKNELHGQNHGCSNLNLPLTYDTTMGSIPGSPRGLGSPKHHHQYASPEHKAMNVYEDNSQSIPGVGQYNSASQSHTRVPNISSASGTAGTGTNDQRSSSASQNQSQSTVNKQGLTFQQVYKPDGSGQFTNQGTGQVQPFQNEGTSTLKETGVAAAAGEVTAGGATEPSSDTALHRPASASGVTGVTVNITSNKNQQSQSHLHKDYQRPPGMYQVPLRELIRPFQTNSPVSINRSGSPVINQPRSSTPIRVPQQPSFPLPHGHKVQLSTDKLIDGHMHQGPAAVNVGPTLGWNSHPNERQKFLESAPKGKDFVQSYSTLYPEKDLRQLQNQGIVLPLHQSTHLAQLQEINHRREIEKSQLSGGTSTMNMGNHNDRSNSPGPGGLNYNFNLTRSNQGSPGKSGSPKNRSNSSGRNRNNQQQNQNQNNQHFKGLVPANQRSQVNIDDKRVQHKMYHSYDSAAPKRETLQAMEQLEMLTQVPTAGNTVQNQSQFQSQNQSQYPSQNQSQKKKTIILSDKDNNIKPTNNPYAEARRMRESGIQQSMNNMTLAPGALADSRRATNDNYGPSGPMANIRGNTNGRHSDTVDSRASFSNSSVTNLSLTNPCYGAGTKLTLGLMSEAPPKVLSPLSTSKLDSVNSVSRSPDKKNNVRPNTAANLPSTGQAVIPDSRDTDSLSSAVVSLPDVKKGKGSGGLNKSKSNQSINRILFQ